MRVGTYVIAVVPTLAVLRGGEWVQIGYSSIVQSNLGNSRLGAGLWVDAIVISTYFTSLLATLEPISLILPLTSHRQLHQVWRGLIVTWTY